MRTATVFALIISVLLCFLTRVFGGPIRKESSDSNIGASEKIVLSIVGMIVMGITCNSLCCICIMLLRDFGPRERD
ncbi:unnamed protein product [Caenorhabditis angaria]|uniref:Uncharacterized protein n=1 Tax=Caenorhabditis angaria TaxID=860376 RepID=A0A9P1N7D6_9PELO|nr:unnamed protein product [Caenorhabditis angaria]